MIRKTTKPIYLLNSPANQILIDWIIDLIGEHIITFEKFHHHHHHYLYQALNTN